MPQDPLRPDQRVPASGLTPNEPEVSQAIRVLARYRVVGLLQGTYRFNLGLVVERTDGHYQHYWRDSAAWHAGPVIT
jgi:hypothetical protein